MVSAKLIIVVLLTLIAAVTLIAWYISIFGLLISFYREAGEELDSRYISEFSSRPEIVRPQRLKYASYALYTALFFSLDIIFDTTRIVPASFMYLGFFIAALMLGKIGSFKKTRIFAPIAFLLIIASEIHHKILVPYGAIFVHETPLPTVASGTSICVAGSVAAMLCVRSLLLELREMQKQIGGSEISVSAAWISFCVLITLWAAGYAVPYLYNYFAVVRFFSAVVFIWQFSKIVSFINDEEQER